MALRFRCPLGVSGEAERSPPNQSGANTISLSEHLQAPTPNRSTATEMKRLREEFGVFLVAFPEILHPQNIWERKAFSRKKPLQSCNLCSQTTRQRVMGDRFLSRCWEVLRSLYEGAKSQLRTGYKNLAPLSPDIRRQLSKFCWHPGSCCQSIGCGERSNSVTAMAH